MSKRFVLILMCVFSCVAAVNAARIDSCSCGTPGQIPTPFVIRHINPDAQAAAMDAFTIWNYYVDVFRPTAEQGNFGLDNGVSEIYFRDLTEVFGMDGASFLGITFPRPDGAFGTFNECPLPPGQQCGTFTEADVMMNTSFDWQTTRPGLGEGGTYYQATATHELGHALGFHHNWQNYSEMNYLPHFTRFLSRADVLGARQKYPSRVKQVTDLATYPFVYDETRQTGGDDGSNGIKIATVSPLSVAPGGNITVKNWTIENLSNGPTSNVRLRLYLSTDTNITTSDIFIAYFYWDPNLPTWDQDADGTQFKVPSDVPAGRYYLGAIVGTGDNNFSTDPITYNNSWYIPTPISVGSGTGVTPQTCTPNATTLCALNNRFSVVVNWRDKGSQSGKANAIRYTDSTAATTGLFWFSSADNIEMIVKVLDQCSFNNRFWVFAAAASDLGFDIIVTDLKTGKTSFRPFHNDAGTRAPAITDTGAFVCP